MDVILEKRFCERVREAIEAKGWSQSELARHLGVTRANVSHYLTGRKSPGLDVIERFAQALGRDPLELLSPAPIEMALPIG